jgi:hypothetical protein
LPLAYSPIQASSYLALLTCLVAAPHRFLFDLRKPRVPTLFVWLTESESCPAAPCGAPECQSFPLPESSVELILEAPRVELSLIFIFDRTHYGPTSIGEILSPPGRAPMPGKATIQPGGRLMSWKAPFETD